MAHPFTPEMVGPAAVHSRRRVSAKSGVGTMHHPTNGWPFSAGPSLSQPSGAAAAARWLPATSADGERRSSFLHSTAVATTLANFSMLAPNQESKVVLYGWFLTKPSCGNCSKDSSNVPQVAIGGYRCARMADEDFFVTAPIVQRLERWRLLTMDGLEVGLLGMINMERSIANGFCSPLVHCFMIGFPSMWAYMLLNLNSMTLTSSCPSFSSLSGSPSNSEVQGRDEKNDVEGCPEMLHTLSSEANTAHPTSSPCLFPSQDQHLPETLRRKFHPGFSSSSAIPCSSQGHRRDFKNNIEGCPEVFSGVPSESNRMHTNVKPHETFTDTLRQCTEINTTSPLQEGVSAEAFCRFSPMTTSPSNNRASAASSFLHSHLVNENVEAEAEFLANSLFLYPQKLPSLVSVLRSENPVRAQSSVSNFMDCTCGGLTHGAGGNAKQVPESSSPTQVPTMLCGCSLCATRGVKQETADAVCSSAQEQGISVEGQRNEACLGVMQLEVSSGGMDVVAEKQMDGTEQGVIQLDSHDIPCTPLQTIRKQLRVELRPGEVRKEVELTIDVDTQVEETTTVDCRESGVLNLTNTVVEHRTDEEIKEVQQRISLDTQAKETITSDCRESGVLDPTNTVVDHRTDEEMKVAEQRPRLDSQAEETITGDCRESVMLNPTNTVVEHRTDEEMKEVEQRTSVDSQAEDTTTGDCREIVVLSPTDEHVEHRADEQMKDVVLRVNVFPQEEETTAEECRESVVLNPANQDVELKTHEELKEAELRINVATQEEEATTGDRRANALPKPPASGDAELRTNEANTEVDLEIDVDPQEEEITTGDSRESVLLNPTDEDVELRTDEEEINEEEDGQNMDSAQPSMKSPVTKTTPRKKRRRVSRNYYQSRKRRASSKSSPSEQDGKESASSDSAYVVAEMSRKDEDKQQVDKKSRSPSKSLNIKVEKRVRSPTDHPFQCTASSKLGREPEQVQVMTGRQTRNSVCPPPIPTPRVADKSKVSDAFGLKRSLRGRVLVPPLATWRNQSIQYDIDGGIIGISNGLVGSEFECSTGSNSFKPPSGKVAQTMQRKLCKAAAKGSKR